MPFEYERNEDVDERTADRVLSPLRPSPTGEKDTPPVEPATETSQGKFVRKVESSSRKGWVRGDE